jgi:hypothetical protein
VQQPFPFSRRISRMRALRSSLFCLRATCWQCGQADALAAQRDRAGDALQLRAQLIGDRAPAGGLVDRLPGVLAGASERRLHPA